MELAANYFIRDFIREGGKTGKTRRFKSDTEVWKVISGEMKS